MSMKKINEPMLQFDGGDADYISPDKDKVKSKSLWCSHDDDEPCGPSCTFQKFPKDKTSDKDLMKARKQDRIGFITKTYGILLTQLIFTAAFVGAAITIQALTDLVQSIWVPAIIFAVISILALIFGSAGADEENGTPNGRPMHMVVPYNYILLGIFTVCISICIAKIANASEPQIVFEAFCLTTAAVIGITFYAMTGLKKVKGIEKFSIMTPALSAVGMIFAVTGLFVFLPVTNLVKSKEAVVEGEAPSGTNYRVFYAAIAIVLFSIIMLFDTAQVIGGKSMMFELGPECYILGALQLYLEYINMFVLILVILGETG